MIDTANFTTLADIVAAGRHAGTQTRITGNGQRIPFTHEVVSRHYRNSRKQDD
jgi:hypothetical protein